jgi:hypothetical protein
MGCSYRWSKGYGGWYGVRKDLGRLMVSSIGGDSGSDGRIERAVLPLARIIQIKT